MAVKENKVVLATKTQVESQLKALADEPEVNFEGWRQTVEKPKVVEPTREPYSFVKQVA